MPGPSQGQVDLTESDSYADPELWSFDCIGLVRWAWYKATGRDLITERTTQATFAAPGYAHSMKIQVNTISARWDRYQGAFRPHADVTPGVCSWDGRGSFHGMVNNVWSFLPDYHRTAVTIRRSAAH
ncbi:hypothetical protein [Streptomyces caeruleatus]|uniref:Uncharacterized protein n=1 Tax=Streptomyces caeruleatus TaxID=661399 RepID=A0A101U2N5_9ACTN|nr:hypothetical protein [Streptomyces caeruleatus]KUO03027.1 hypothetical protein AQJ67_18725 [Streptomyces caeruleatus]